MTDVQDFDVQVLIIGAGMSGIGIGIQLQRQRNIQDFEIIEKSDNVGGTWFLNTYPGCGCDVPSHFYSYSFELNPDWSQVYAMQPEIHRYFRSIADKYDIPRHVKFNSSVLSAHWNGDNATWEVTIQDQRSKRTYTRRCRILISAVGALSIPKKCEIPGVEKFKGHLFHSAQWNHTFDWKGKEVVTIGNGCSATQFVPIISDGPNAVKKVTQFSRQAHWLSERPNPSYSPLVKSLFRYLPGLMRVYRAYLYWMQEKTFSGFNIVTGAGKRAEWTKVATEYIRRAAPAKYVDALIPKSLIGCKRRVNDTDYLACLHRDNVDLVYDDPIDEIVENGVRTRSGKVVNADAIVLATGFETQNALFPLEIFGEDGIGLNEYWNNISEGSASAYFGTCLGHFPNFFIMMGPNTVSGHLSVIYTTECQINFAMRMIAPIVSSLRSTKSLLPQLITPVDSVVVTPEAAHRDDTWVQSQAKQIVWASGCSSWFVDPKTGRNTQMYPDWQWRFWVRSFWYPSGDFVYGSSKALTERGKTRTRFPLPELLGVVTVVTGIVAMVGLSSDLRRALLSAKGWDWFTEMSKIGFV